MWGHFEQCWCSRSLEDADIHPSLARWRYQPDHPHCAASFHGGQAAAGGLRSTGTQLRGAQGGDPEGPRVLWAQEGGALRPHLGHHLCQAPTRQSRFVSVPPIVKNPAKISTATGVWRTKLLWGFHGVGCPVSSPSPTPHWEPSLLKHAGGLNFQAYKQLLTLHLLLSKSISQITNGRKGKQAYCSSHSFIFMSVPTSKCF